MVNIELELVSDVNLDQAFCILARTLAAGRLLGSEVMSSMTR